MIRVPRPPAATRTATLLVVACAAIAGWALAVAPFVTAPREPVVAAALVVALAGWAASAVAVRALATVQVPVRGASVGAAWPGHPRRRAGGDVPRQHHPDSAGRRRPRAPGAR